MGDMFCPLSQESVKYHCTPEMEASRRLLDLARIPYSRFQHNAQWLSTQWPKFPWVREAEDRLKTKYPYVCYAELNAIMNKTSVDVKGCTIYVTLFPCNECAKVLIQSGIKKVVYLSNKYALSEETIASDRLLKGAGIGQRQFDLKHYLSALLNSINPLLSEKDQDGDRSQNTEGEKS